MYIIMIRANYVRLISLFKQLYDILLKTKHYLYDISWTQHLYLLTAAY